MRLSITPPGPIRRTSQTLVGFDPSAMSGTLVGGQLEHVQVECGEFRGCVARSASEQLSVDWGSYSLAVLARGAVSADRISLGLLVGGRGDWHVLGKRGCNGQMVMLPEGSELLVTLPARPQWLVMQVSRRRLEKVGVDLRGLSSTNGWHLPMHNVDLERTVGDVAGVLAPARSDDPLAGPPASDEAVIEEAHEQLFAGMVGAWAALSASQREPWGESQSSSERRRVVQRAEAYLADRRDANIRMDELCAAACTSLSRLERSFRDVLGLSPHRYLTLRRMAAVRGELLAGMSGATVTETAMRWGFFHLGRFAQDYCTLFGERPSQTLRHGSARH